PISTLLYRLRQNAFSLGTICLLSMTTLVVIATTSCLYFGAQHSLQQDYPTDVKVSVSYKEQLPDSGFLFSQIEEILQKHQQTPKNLKELYSLNFSVPADPSQTSLEDDKVIFAKDAVLISVLTADSYKQLTGTPIEALEKNQILLFDSAGKTPPSSFSLLGETYGVKDKLTTFPESNIPLESTMNRYGLVVDTTETMMKIYQGQTAEYREYGGVGTVMTYTIQFDLTGTAAEKKECEQALKA
ncbi:MAG: hypothetical protein RR661_08750, partial [Anaerovoracaceae bacterium]